MVSGKSNQDVLIQSDMQFMVLGIL